MRSIATGADQAGYAPVGHSTGLAARMQAFAPTGSIAISEQTRKFVAGYFQLKPLGPTKVKGVSEPVNAYEVTGLSPLRPGSSSRPVAASPGSSARDAEMTRCVARWSLQSLAIDRSSQRLVSRGRQVASILRVQNDLAIKLDDAGNDFGLLSARSK